MRTRHISIQACGQLTALTAYLTAGLSNKAWRPTVCRTGLSIPTFKLYFSLLFIVRSSIKMANQSDILFNEFESNLFFKANTNSALFSANTNTILILISCIKVRTLKAISLIYKYICLIIKADKTYIKKKYLYKYCPPKDT
jgi:hypothetical protein